MIQQPGSPSYPLEELHLKTLQFSENASARNVENLTLGTTFIKTLGNLRDAKNQDISAFSAIVPIIDNMRAATFELEHIVKLLSDITSSKNQRVMERKRANQHRSKCYREKMKKTLATKSADKKSKKYVVPPNTPDFSASTAFSYDPVSLPFDIPDNSTAFQYDTLSDPFALPQFTNFV
jgi:hypothetical protein